MAKKKKQAISTPQVVQQKTAHEVVGSILQNLGISSTPFVPSPIQEGDELLTPALALVKTACGAISVVPLDGEATFVAEAAARPSQSNGTVPRVSRFTVPLVAGGSGHGGEPECSVHYSSPSPEHNVHKVNEDRAASLPDLELNSRISGENRAASSPVLEQNVNRASSFTGKLAAKGATLSFVAPKVQDGKLIAELQAAELEEVCCCCVLLVLLLVAAAAFLSVAAALLCCCLLLLYCYWCYAAAALLYCCLCCCSAVLLLLHCSLPCCACCWCCCALLCLLSAELLLAGSACCCC
ncbi:uncharacterized protein LOC110700235 [Chenopodium quinoa]|uniref:uncharacterized protein LOC110700235 n=1 Tax=Chenopodium quinoa TaxID=63459 RepID=UPI000B797394|nr:uncharacterized protein LOC110700235 [Chenopodium quinoa]